LYTKKNYKLLINDDSLKKRDYFNRFPDDDVSRIIIKKFINGEYVEDVSKLTYSSSYKNFKNNHVSINNYDL
jgi:hypothetical protein